MPELPEVETVRRGLAPVMVGALIERVDQRRPDLRFPFPVDFVERLEGRRIESLGRRAKYLLADLDDGAVLVMHLGMSGSFRIDAGTSLTTPGLFHAPRAKNPAHDHVALYLAGGVRVIYNDPRRFGFMNLLARASLNEHKLFRDLGIEPLGNEFDAAALCARLRGRTAPIKAALLDQTVVAGLGNIYVCEALHWAGLSPRRPAKAIAGMAARPGAKAQRLVQSIRDVLEEAIEAGGSSLRDHRMADGSLGYFQHRFRVYDREGEACRTAGCSGVIRRLSQSGRSTFYCPACQK